MRKRSELHRFLALLAFVVLSASVPGLLAREQGPADIQAANCSQSAVQAAINAAQSGARVVVPAGNCTWTAAVKVTDKKVNLIGAGIDATNITSNIPGVSPLQVTTCSASHFFLASGFTWRLQSAGSATGIISIGCSNVSGHPPVAFRITQMKMHGDPADGVSSGGRFLLSSGVYGVVDHSSFYSHTARGAGNISMTFDSALSTSNAYHEPFTLGDANALFVEDNYFYFGVANSGNGAVDNYAGARYVFRYNTVINNHSGHHGFDTAPRGVPTFEYYGNTFIAESGIGDMHVIVARSGTGVVIGNTVTNKPGAAKGYSLLLAPQYYGGVNHADAIAIGALWYATRPAEVWHPTGPWGGAYNGTTKTIGSRGNFATGSNPFDGNLYGPGSMDPDYTRTVTDMVTTSGSTTITSASANFVAGDLRKTIQAQNFAPGRILADAVFSSGSPTVTSATGNFTAADVGRHVSTDNRTTISGFARIKSVTNGTTIVLDKSATASTTAVLLMADPFIVSITNSTTAVMNVPATASQSGRTLSIGYTNQGYPLLDQPGRGYFASANAGNWPNASSYSELNYQALMPIYLAANVWNGGEPPATAVYFPSTTGYMKTNREWYDQLPAGRFNGTVGTGYGTLSQRPATCTTGVGYWATDQGSWNASGADGVLYKCTARNTWTLYYTPYSYPHPLTGLSSNPPTTKLTAPKNLRIVP